jgi:hypothetical protein
MFHLTNYILFYAKNFISSMLRVRAATPPAARDRIAGATVSSG